MTTRKTNTNNNKRKSTTSLKENDSMSKNEITIALSDETIAAIAAQVAEVLGVEAEVEAKPAAKGKATKEKAKPTRGKKVVEEEPDEDEEEDEEEGDEEFDQEARQAELAKMRITALRKMAIELGFPEDEVAEADKDTLAESIAEAEAEDAGGEDAEDEEADEEEEDDEGDEDYESMTIAELRAAAKEAGYSAADIKGLKKDEIIDLLNSDEEGEEEEEDEEDEDEDGDDEEWYTEEDLEDSSLAELKAICKDYSIKVPRGAKQADLIDLIVNFEG